MPAPFLTLADLQVISRQVGIELTEVTDDARSEVYVFSSSDDQRILYVGKSTGRLADVARNGVEQKIITDTRDGGTAVYAVGFTRLIIANNGELHRIAFDVARPTLDAAVTNGWTSSLAMPAPFTAADIERFLIRVPVLCGVVIGNSSGAGQWESQMYTPMDVLAEIAITDSVYDGWRSGGGVKPTAS